MRSALKPLWVGAAFLASLLLAPGCDFAGEEPSAALAGTSWQLQAFGETPAPERFEYSLSFANESEFGGRSGCNGIGGEYSASGDGDFEVSKLITTYMACTAETREEDFQRRLGAADAYEVEGDRLTIASGEGNLVFERASGL